MRLPAEVDEVIILGDGDSDRPTTLAHLLTAGRRWVATEVGPGGEVTSWSWVAAPRDVHPLDEPFAFALVKLDGADVPFLHVVKADESAMATGMRVTATWKDEREGHITDLACFIPEEGQ